ncbi:MAG: hypothetical protein JSV26_05460 [bacterium]|nr:MAG: hypothetical protein JSV26_05460 [bacterium]
MERSGYPGRRSGVVNRRMGGSAAPFETIDRRMGARDRRKGPEDRRMFPLDRRQQAVEIWLGNNDRRRSQRERRGNI